MSIGKAAEGNAEITPLDSQGFAIRPGIFDADEMAALGETLAEITGPGDGKTVGQRDLLRRCPAVARVASDARLRALLTPWLGPGAIPVRALFFDKTPVANWKVPWHQDLTITVRERIETPGFGPWSVKAGASHVQPPVEVLEGMLTARIHLDDADESNGALRVLPGSHAAGRLDAPGIQRWREERDAVTCEVPAGGVLLMRPLLLHASSVARVNRPRRVVHLEFAAEALPGGLRWHASGGPGEERREDGR